MTLISFLEKAESFENLTLVFKKYFENVLEQNSHCEAEELFFKSYIDILHNYMNGGLMLFPLSLAVIRGPEKSRKWQEDLDIDETFWDDFLWIKELGPRVRKIQWDIYNNRENINFDSKHWLMVDKIMRRLKNKINQGYYFIYIIFCLLLRFGFRDKVLNYQFCNYYNCIFFNIEQILDIMEWCDIEDSKNKTELNYSFKKAYSLYNTFLFKAKNIVEKDFILKEDFFLQKWENFLNEN